MSFGILALQGAFAKHIEVLATLDRHAVELRRPEGLAECQALIIPGGESSTMTRMLEWGGWWDELRGFARRCPVMGTCAGAILMASEVSDGSVPGLGLIDMTIERNGYGRQLQSCHTEVEWADGSLSPGFFIRAPRILRVGPDVEILARWQGEPVLVRQGTHLAATFHPELTGDTRVHRLFA